jgi:hypothetical protein
VTQDLSEAQLLDLLEGRGADAAGGSKKAKSGQ